MITIISGTNRPNNMTLKFAQHLQTIFQKHTTEPVHLIDLHALPHDWYHAAMYGADTQSDSIREVQDKYLLPAEKVVYVAPEYNGSFAGVMKLFIDAVSIREYKPTFAGKKAALVGVSTGRAGNLRGLTHLTGVLNHVGSVVFPNQLPLSLVGGFMTEDGEITSEDTLKLLDDYAQSFIAF